MHEKPRRDFLRSVASFAVPPAVRTETELILHNGHFLSIDDAQPHARAVGIAGDRFVAVGADAHVLNLATSRTRKIDLGGRSVVHGFIDAHTHPAAAGFLHLKRVDCELRSIDAIVSALRERAAKTPPGEWVLGFKYDDPKTAQGRPLDRAGLDGVPTSHPILVVHRAGTPASSTQRPSP